MATIYLFLLLFAAGNRPVDACDIRTVRGKVMVRGFGGISSDGPILFDYTCPLVASNGFVLARSILIEERDGSPKDPHFVSLKSGDLFQAVIEGEIECRQPMSYGRSDDGDIVGGNGFGSLGLLNCRMKSAHVKTIYSLSELGYSSPPARR